MGALLFPVLVLEKFFLSRYLARLPRPVRHILTLLGILFGWLLFGFDGSAHYLTTTALWQFLAALVGKNGFLSENAAFDLVRHLPFLLLAALGCTPLPRKIFYHLFEKRRVFGVILPLAGLLLSVCYLADAGFNPFLYFRF